MEDLHLFCVILYPISSILSSFGLIKYKYFFLKSIHTCDCIQLKIINDYYVIS